jgi:hypothetical protein
VPLLLRAVVVVLLLLLPFVFSFVNAKKRTTQK